VALDYSKTAENLVNPPEVKALLDTFHQKQAELDAIRAEIPAELLSKIDAIYQELGDLNTAIRDAIEQYGSYQDVEKGHYAVKYRRVSKCFENPEAFKARYPSYAPAVIVETIDPTKVQGLIKGNLLAEEELKEAGILVEQISFAFVIK